MMSNKYDDDDNRSELDPLLATATSSSKNKQIKWSDVLTRYFALALMCTIGFGAYFVFDTPAALVDDIKKDLKISTTTYASFYSWYSLPNVVMCFAGGFLIDRVFGVRLGSIACLSLVLCGQLMFAIGVFKNSILVMDLGRFILGIGSGNLSICSNTYAVRWFFGKELNFVFGLTISISHLGSTLSLTSMTPIYEHINKSKSGTDCLGTVFLISCVPIVFSIVVSIILAWLDFKCCPTSNNNNNNNSNNNELIHDSNSSSEPAQSIKLTDVFRFPLSLWLVYAICVTFYCTLFPFISLSKVFFISKYDFDPSKAAGVSSFIYITSAFALPISGFLSDMTGYNTIWIMIGLVIAVFSNVLLSFTFVNPYIAMVILGLSYSMMASSLWPMVALIIPKHQLSTAFGLMFSIQSAGLALINILSGAIVDHLGYFTLQMFFLALLCLSLMSASLLFFTDRFRNGILGVSRKERARLVESKAQIQISNND